MEKRFPFMRQHSTWTLLVIIVTFAMGVTSCTPRAPQPVAPTVAAAPTSTPLDESAYRKQIADVRGSVGYTLNYMRRDLSRAHDDPHEVEDFGWRKMWLEQSTTLRDHATWARTTTPPPDWQQYHAQLVQALDSFVLALDAVDRAVAAHDKGEDAGFETGFAESIVQIEAGYASLDAARPLYDERMP